MDKLDILNREEFVNKLVNLTENISANRTSTSFAINGVWGCGKSFVLDMYEERLNEIPIAEKAIDKYFVIRYNCWKYDYYEEPLVAIVAAMIDIINQKTKLWNDEQKKALVLGALKAIGTTFLSMTNSAIKDKTGLDIQSAYKTTKSKIDEEKTKIENSHEYDVYFSFNQALHSLQELIRDLSKDQTIVFMVDELDRCLPEYSIKVLERLHHLTENTDNVITVLSIDKSQLEKSVKQIFGFDDPEKYLEKFINFEIALNVGEISEKITEKYFEYIKLFDKNLFPYEDSTEEFLQTILNGINVRTQELIFKKAKIAHQLLFPVPYSADYSCMCMEILLTTFICYYNRYDYLSKNKFQFVLGEYASYKVDMFDGLWVDFFSEKISCLDFSIVYGYMSTQSSTIGVRENSPSLYVAILFLWSLLHSKRDVTIQLTSGSCFEALRDKEKYLQKFIDIIKIIQ